jgi:N-acylneuraminate cytidylyltransferase/CMP-N,N'-diacetyllegionaminic acid synthase
MNVLALVIARGGSKGVPGKNLKPLGGIPLVAYKIVSARKSRFIRRVILSTDSAEIQRVGLAYGAEVPFLRPAELATDTASSDDVALHAMSWIESQSSPVPDALLLLEPSTPFATGADYDRAVELMDRTQAVMVVGMVPHKTNRVFIGEMDEAGRLKAIIDQMQSLHRLDRQALPPNFTMNGAFYLLNWRHFRQARRRYVDPDNSYGIEMDEFHSVEIDQPVDLAWAQFLIDRGLVDTTPWRFPAESSP